MTILPKAIYRFSAILTKISTFFFFAEQEKHILKSIQNQKASQIAKTILKEKEQSGKLTLPNFKTYYHSKQYATGIKTDI